jgi:hypothetical protein
MSAIGFRSWPHLLPNRFHGLIFLPSGGGTEKDRVLRVRRHGCAFLK